MPKATANPSNARSGRERRGTPSVGALPLTRLRNHGNQIAPRSSSARPASNIVRPADMPLQSSADGRSFPSRKVATSFSSASLPARRPAVRCREWRLLHLRRHSAPTAMPSVAAAHTPPTAAPRAISAAPATPAAIFPMLIIPDGSTKLMGSAAAYALTIAFL